MLGCINDYCENQHFNTIVVANEEKINNVTIGEISYEEIKEKVIQRTVRHIPDYTEIIKGVIKEMSCRHVKYKNLLQDNIENITTIFSGTTVEGVSLDNLATVQERRYGSREEKEHRDKAMEPKDIVRTHRIIDIEEEVIKKGFPEVLQMAYNGELTIDEYVNFIQNSYLARTYDAPVPDIEWPKIQTGLKMKIESLLRQGIEQSHTRIYISSESIMYLIKM